MIEIMDTTLRDGEQTAGVSFNADEKLAIARLLLEELKVNRIEVGSARVSSGEQEAFSKICSWAATCGHLDAVEALGFVDGGLSIDWISSAGGRVMNLLTKGSLRHVEGQLRKTPREHLDDILRNISKAVSRGLEVNVYLEDWSGGMTDSPDYVFFLVDALKDAPVRRIMLPDTLGILDPDRTALYCRTMVERYPGIPCGVDARDGNALSDALTSALANVARAENDSDPQHSFFIGLAYLDGIDVEVDYERALSLITFAALTPSQPGISTSSRYRSYALSFASRSKADSYKSSS